MAEEFKEKSPSETAWLLERRVPSGSLYYGGKKGWVTNADAIRFARHEDVISITAALVEAKVIPVGTYIAAEHMWVG